MSYCYVDVEQNHSQYEGETFDYGTYCDAKYVKSPIAAYQGNKYIEALPQVPDMKTIFGKCFKPIPHWNNDNDSKTELQKMMEIHQLENIRIPLSYYMDLWNEIYLSMVNSYSKRKQLSVSTDGKELQVCGDIVINEGDLIAVSKAAPSGFNMIGESGCGKSSALELALSYYPKVIRHLSDNGMYTIQIPYLFVTCPPDSNFTVLYRQIGKELDRYLGNSEPLIENEIMGRTRSSLGDIRARVAKVIERFAIGLLIVDEIQHLSFANMSERSFNALKVLANETMVSIGVVGTNDALMHIYTDEQTARRVGTSILCDQYASNEDYYNSIVKFIFRYKWFDDNTSLTTDIVHLIYKESHGIIAYIILIYEMICIDYISRNSKTDPINIDEKYVFGVIDKYFGIVKHALELKCIDEHERERVIQKSIAKAKGTIEYQILKEREKQNQIEEIEFLENGINSYDLMKGTVINKVRSIYSDFPESRLSKIYDDVFLKASAKVKTNDALLSQRVISKLTTEHTARKIKTKNKDIQIIKEEAQEIINNSCIDPNIDPDSMF